jgi:hypothetical protein
MSTPNWRAVACYLAAAIVDDDRNELPADTLRDHRREALEIYAKALQEDSGESADLREQVNALALRIEELTRSVERLHPLVFDQ